MPTTTHAAETPLVAQLDTILADKLIRMVFQPIVELDSGKVVGFEALARGPADSPLERPDQLFVAARRAGRLPEIDAACREAALSKAAKAGLCRPWTLFLNAEPETLDGGPLASPQLPLVMVLELTERRLTAKPAELLQTIARVREAGWGVALDDVGADPASLALLPLVQPDVIKLDLALVQQHPSAGIAAITHAVQAEAERSGTIILAEGIETPAHLQTARAFGATLGQGWLFGRPGPLPASLQLFEGSAICLASIERPHMAGGTDAATHSPFEIVARTRPVHPAVKPLLIEASKHLEQQALNSGESALVVSTFQEARFFTPATRLRFARLAERAAFVGVLAEGMSAEPLPGVRGAVLDPTDALLGEWDIAVVGPHFAACLVARDLGDEGPDAERRFDFALTHNRDLTVAAALSMMSRIWPRQVAKRAGGQPPQPPRPRDPVS